MIGKMTSGKMTSVAALSAALVGVVFAGRAVEGQQPADVAARLSGSGVLNRDLSTGFAPRGRGRGAPPSPRLRRPSPLFAMAAAAAAQRGGLSTPSDATDQTPQQRAEQAAMRQLEQISDRITTKASADSVTFVDARGERTFAINDKTSTIDVGGTSAKVKSKWDKRVLRQEFTNSQAGLIQTWGLDDSGHLVLTAKVESMTLNLGAGADRPTALVTPDQKAVFDRQ